MVKLSDGTELFKHREYVDWHAPFKPQEFAGECPNGNCPWETHRPENSAHDPLSVAELLSIPTGTRMLVLTDYCGRQFVSLHTLNIVFQPEGATQLRFAERSRRCWYFQPDTTSKVRTFGGPGSIECGHAIYLDSTRYAATIRTDAPAFGKDGQLPCFMRELSRLARIPLSEVKRGVRELEKSVPKLTPSLKPWQMDARSMWADLCAKRTSGLADRLKYFLGFRKGYLPIAILLVVAAERGKLQELGEALADKKPAFPENFSGAIDHAVEQVTCHWEEGREQAKGWKREMASIFGIKGING